MVIYLILFLSLILLCIVTNLTFKKKKTSLLKKHIVITGGSSGIGKELAILAAKKGAHVTIIARNTERLKSVENQIKKVLSSDQQIVTAISADVAKYDDIRAKLLELENIVGAVYMLINCAGYAHCGKVEDFSAEDVKKLMDINYFGTLYPIQALLPNFKKRKEGIIILTASQAALVGLYGYSIYSSCKFALRGLAEALAMEVKPYNISITLALPPDTDTPGFEIENKSKPEETHLISSTGGLHKPEDVASQILEDAVSGKFFSVVGFESFILTTLCVGMSPVYNIWELFLQILLLGPLRAVGVVYLFMFNDIVKKCYLKNQKEKEN